MQIRGILFDWGGTLALVDRQTEALTRGATRVLESFVGRADPGHVRSLLEAAIEAERVASLGPDYPEVDLGDLLRAWTGEQGIPIRNGQIEAALEIIGENWVGAALTPIQGVHETLAVLRAMGLRMCLVSNCFIPLPYCHEELRVQRFADLLDGAVFSSGVGYRKPSRRIYDEARTRLAQAGGPEEYSEILFVGDSPAYDVIMPAALGMHTALVSSTTGIWSPEDYDRARPDFRIDSVSELPTLLADLS